MGRFSSAPLGPQPDRPVVIPEHVCGLLALVEPEAPSDPREGRSREPVVAARGISRGGGGGRACRVRRKPIR